VALVLRICRQYVPPGVRLAGELDYEAGEELSVALAEALRLDGDITVNMTALTMIDAACTRMILDAARSLPPGRVMMLRCSCRPESGSPSSAQPGLRRCESCQSMTASDLPEGGTARPGASPPPQGGRLLLDQRFGPGTLYQMRAAALAHAVAAGMPEACAGDVVAVVQELAGNAVRHGAGRGRLRMWSQDGTLHCVVEDGPRPGLAGQAGENGNAGRNAAAQWPYQHGHGLWLVRLLADQMSIVSGPDGTRAAAQFALNRQRHPSEQEQPLASWPG
jgi:anti-sigma regulatory factor (Ser/Thr protein kinase)